MRNQNVHETYIQNIRARGIERTTNATEDIFGCKCVCAVTGFHSVPPTHGATYKYIHTSNICLNVESDQWITLTALIMHILYKEDYFTIEFILVFNQSEPESLYTRSL